MSSEPNHIDESNKGEESKEIQNILKEIPEEILIKVITDRLNNDSNSKFRKIVQAVSQQSFSGPIPPPTMLSEYNSAHEGLADRIVAMAESQQKHRQSLEKISVDAAIKTESRGQHYALIVSLLIIFGSLFLIGSGKEVAGSILAGGTLTGLAYIFITGRKKEESDSEVVTKD